MSYRRRSPEHGPGGDKHPGKKEQDSLPASGSPIDAEALAQEIAKLAKHRPSEAVRRRLTGNR